MSPRVRLLVALASTVVTCYVAVGSLLGRVFGDTSYGQLTVFNEVVRMVLDSYVEPVNLDKAMAGAEQGLTDALDGDSAYLDAEEWKALRQAPKETDAEVGVVLSRRYAFLIVVAARSGSPAEKAGLRPADVLKTIDGRHTRTLPVPVGERLLRGAPGSVVKLKVLRAGSDPLDFSVVRERLTPPGVKGRLLEDGTGYLKVPEFRSRVADDVRLELDTLRHAGARKLVLDLRSAAFGAPAEGVGVAELFLKGGVVAKLAGRRMPEQVLSADATRTAWDHPLVVLVDTGTAGPGEVVAASLAESGRATLVGERTFGRAGVQRTVPLPEGGMLLTVAKYSTPKGVAIHGRGLEPAVSVDLQADDSEAAATRDLVLERALEVLKTQDRKAA